MKFIWSVLLLGFLSFLIFCKYTQGAVTANETLPLSSNDRQGNYTKNLLLIGMQIRGTSFGFRNRIRETLLKLKYFQRGQVKFIFVIATPPEPHQHIVADILKERDTYQDILFLDDIVDGWRQLAVKQKKFLQYAMETNYLFSMKLDDDAYVSMEYLTNYLENLVLEGKSNDCYYVGSLHIGAVPIRDPNSRYYFSREEYPRDDIPIFMNGYAAVWSNAFIEELFTKNCTDKLLYLGDITMALWVEKYLKLNDAKKLHIINLDNYNMEIEWYEQTEPKNLPNIFYNLIHHINEDQVHCLYKCDLEGLSCVKKFKCLDDYPRKPGLRIV